MYQYDRHKIQYTDPKRVSYTLERECNLLSYQMRNPVLNGQSVDAAFRGNLTRADSIQDEHVDHRVGTGELSAPR